MRAFIENLVSYYRQKFNSYEIVVLTLSDEAKQEAQSKLREYEVLCLKANEFAGMESKVVIIYQPLGHSKHHALKNFYKKHGDMLDNIK